MGLAVAVRVGMVLSAVGEAAVKVKVDPTVAAWVAWEHVAVTVQQWGLRTAQG